MTYDELLAKKNKVMTDLLAKKQEGGKGKQTVLRALADEAAYLEGLLGAHWLRQGKPQVATRNLISQASCLLDTRRRAEAGRVLSHALELEIPDSVRAYIKTEFAPALSEAYVPRIPRSKPRIEGNDKLRKPQVRSYQEALAHFANSSEPAIIQLPVGCGKTGAIALVPFNVAKTRVLVLAPNVIIRENLAKKLSYANPDSFWKMAGVFTNGTAPVAVELSDGATLQDTDAADIVVANYQRLVGQSDMLAHLAHDYFDLVLIDEGHHNVTGSYREIFDRFPGARRLSFTATPLRADGVRVEGRPIYRFPISEAIREGYVKDLASRRLEPTEITFTFRGDTRKHSLKEVMELREEDWFSRGIALSEECNASIVDASIQCLDELRANSTERHQIIAAACGVDHAKTIRSLYAARNRKAEVIFNEMEEDEKQRVLRELQYGDLDVIVQVMMLGEGADFKRLSVAAVFRPFRHVVPYVQFIGRIMRVLRERAPGHPDNRGFVVSHVGLNVDRWWEDLRKLDEDDQAFYEAMAHGSLEFQEPKDGQSAPAPTRRRFTADMEVLNETIEYFVQERFLSEISKAQVDDLIHTMQLRGMNFEALGITRQDLEQRLTDASTRVQAKGIFTAVTVDPQEARKEARKRLDERVKSGANQLLRALKVSLPGRDLPNRFPKFNAKNNLVAAIILVNQEVDRFLGLQTGNRDLLTEDECKRAHDSMDKLIDDLVARLKTEEGK